MLVLLLGDAVGLGDEVQLAAQDLDEEVPGPARGLEELDVQRREGVGNIVEHGVDFALVGKDLGQVADPVTGAYLTELGRQWGQDALVVVS